MKPTFQSTIGRKILACLLISCLSFTHAGDTTQAAAVRKADVNTASAGNELLGVEGSYENVAKNTILKRINTIRKEACQKGYIDPSTGKKLSAKDYTAIKWSSDLEWIAQLRAAESTVNEDHTRPNGTTCFSIQHNGEQSWAENLAWNYSGLMAGIEQWYGEKEDWVKQNANAVTGHYTSMIDPSHTYIGLGCFRRSAGGWYGIAAEFSSRDNMDKTKSNLSGKKIQLMEISKSNTGSAKIQAPSVLTAGKKKKLTVVKEISFAGFTGNNTTTGIVQDPVTWKSSDNAVLSVDAKGKASAKKAGNVTITAKISGGKTLKASIRVQ